MQVLPTHDTTKHQVFVSFHNNDRAYREDFVVRYGDHFINKSVDFGDIDPDNKDAYIKRLIRENHISDASVIVALYGNETWKRKHVDWEIYAGLIEKAGGHSGLVVILLPTFPIDPAFNPHDEQTYHLLYPYLHPRTAANLKSGYASLYFWPGMYPHLPEAPVKDIFRQAFNKRVTENEKIDLSHPQYQYNRE